MCRYVPYTATVTCCLNGRFDLGFLCCIPATQRLLRMRFSIFAWSIYLMVNDTSESSGAGKPLHVTYFTFKGQTPVCFHCLSLTLALVCIIIIPGGNTSSLNRLRFGRRVANVFFGHKQGYKNK